MLLYVVKIPVCMHMKGLIPRIIPSPSKYSLRMGFVPVNLTKFLSLTKLAYNVKNLTKLIYLQDIYGLVYAQIILNSPK